MRGVQRRAARHIDLEEDYMARQAESYLARRRTFLKGAAGVGGGVATAGFAGLFGISSASAQSGGDDPQTILNLAATAETLAVTFYYSALTAATFDIEPDDVAYLKNALDSELYHLEFLMSAGGKSLTQQFYVPATLLSDVGVFVQVGTQAETAFVGAYLAATRRLAELGQPRLAATTAQHAASEAVHLAVLRDIGGLVPNDVALPLPIYFNVSDAMPTLAPFLSGGEGFIGPVGYPSKEQLDMALEGNSSVRAPTFTMVF
jgi:hypothetical protein